MKDSAKPTRLAFIGSGAMAEAMIQGILRCGVASAESIWGSGPRAERAQQLSERYGIHGTTNNREAVRDADVVVLSVKPQRLRMVLDDLRGTAQPGQLVISIVAGARISVIAEALDTPSVMRVMPNTPAQIGEGISVWFATPEVTSLQREVGRRILAALGEEIEVDEERFLDMATAVSGTGPTYVFLIMEALVDAAVHLGFSRRIAEALVTKTVEGSVLFARRSNLHLAQMRNMVTSPGGTSAEAIYQLDKGSIRTVLSKAVWAAYQKSKLLGDSLSQGSAPDSRPNGSPPSERLE
jgi:pyrroline-5-carboxylate reductase